MRKPKSSLRRYLWSGRYRARTCDLMRVQHISPVPRLRPKLLATHNFGINIPTSQYTSSGDKRWYRRRVFRIIGVATGLSDMLSNDVVLAAIDSVLSAVMAIPNPIIEQLAEHKALLLHTIYQFSQSGSQFRAEGTEASKQKKTDGFSGSYQYRRYKLTGVLRALRTASERGCLQSVQELVHADVFADFIEMAEYLVQERYKDPAAVLIGGVPEEHLRKLCLKNGITVNFPANNKPRKASSLNDDLTKNDVYDMLEQKSVTAWLDLRNRAAHGNYATYDDKQVDDMLRGVREFLIRHRA